MSSGDAANRTQGGRVGSRGILILCVLAGCASEAPLMPTSTTTTAPAPLEQASFSGTETNLPPAELEKLVGRIALYPDDLLALVLPASTQPLHVVEAQRYLEQRKNEPGAQPPRKWDPSVIALLNYPEALALMNADLVWLQQLGTSVVHQQAGVMDGVQSFRRKALEAGRLKSDDKQSISVQPEQAEPGTSQVIVIEPANPQVIYVPIYQPAAVTYVGPPGYYYPPYYWSAPYPYYYDPAAPFYMGAFFGAVIGFGCNWDDDDIYHGDINIDNVNINRDQVKQRIEERRNSRTAEQIRRNPENRWRADRSGLSQAQANGGAALREAAAGRRAGAGIDRGAAAGSGPGGRLPADVGRTPRSDLGGSRSFGGSDLGGSRSLGGSSPGAFSGIDRGAAAGRYSARGGGSMGGFGGGGFRGGGGRGGGRR
jgi:hypothetical protein